MAENKSNLIGDWLYRLTMGEDYVRKREEDVREQEKAEKNSFWKNLGLALSQGAMAYGEGMTGAPYLSNYQKMLALQKEQEQKEILNDLIKRGGRVGDTTAPYYIKSIDLETGMPKIEFLSPDELREQAFQRGVGTYMGAKQRYNFPVSKLIEKTKEISPMEKPAFIMGRKIIKEGEPIFRNREFIQGESGKWKELRPSLIRPRITAAEQFNTDLVKAQKGEITWDELKGKYPLSTKQKQIEEVRKSTLPKLIRSPEFRFGKGLPAFISPRKANINEKTLKVIEQIQTQEDLDELLERKDEARIKGIDVNAILEYFGKR